MRCGRPIGFAPGLWLIAAALLASGACGNDSTPSGGAGTSGAGGLDGAADSAQPVDPCEVHLERGTCCGDPACGWHEYAGDFWYVVPQCVDGNRVCEVEGEWVRDCPGGMICLRHGGGGTPGENDCAELPPAPEAGVIDTRPGRGICMWPIDAGSDGSLPELPPECPPEGCG